MNTDIVKKTVESFGGWKSSYITLLIILGVIYFMYKIWVSYVMYAVILILLVLYLNEKSKNKKCKLKANNRKRISRPSPDANIIYGKTKEKPNIIYGT